MKNPVQILKDTPLFKGKIASVFKRTMAINGAEVNRTVISLNKDAVMVIALDNQENLIFVHELAAPKGRFINTLIKGAHDAGLSAAEVARKELAEEAGYEPSLAKILCVLDDRPTHLDTTTTVVVLSGCFPLKEPPKGDEEAGTLKVQKVPLANVLKNPLAYFKCARTAAALFEFKRQLNLPL